MAKLDVAYKTTRWIHAGLVLLLIFIAVDIFLIISVLGAQKKLAYQGELRHRSCMLANRLKNSSDDLTRLVRTYAATGNPKFEKQYWDILAIRNGDLPRPVQYEPIYWQFLAVEDGVAPCDNGPPVSLRHLMEEAGFTAEELDLLDHAQRNSDKLVHLEERAMELVHQAVEAHGEVGLPESKEGQEALRLLFSEEYHREKVQIMKPILQFMEKINARTKQDVDTQDERLRILFYALVTFFFFSILTTVWLIFLDRHYHSQMIDELQQTVAERTSELRNLVATKDKLFSIIAHDLRGPLGSIVLCVEDMVESIDEMSTQEIAETLKLLDESASTTYGLLENLLMWARLHTGSIENKYVTAGLSEVISSAVTPLIDVAKQKNIHVDMDIPPELNVDLDIEKMAVITRNLVSNAVKFTPRGGRVVVLAEQTCDQAVISVRDTGIGIPPDHIQDLFCIDNSNHRPGTEEEASSGLGLTLVNEFVQSLGGEIRVESTVGEGTVFTVSLPISQQQ